MSFAMVGLIAQLTVTAVASDTVPIDGAATVTVRVTAESARQPQIDAPSFRPFALLRSDILRRTDRLRGGRIRFTTEYRYSLAPTRLGKFRIGAFTARLGRTTARTTPFNIVVRRSSRAPGSVPAIVARTRLDSANQVQFKSLVLPDTLYIGQQATYQLGVFLEESIRDRLRRMEAIAPEMRGMLAYDPPHPGTGFPGPVVGGKRFEVHVYQRAIFPLEAGRIAIPPARLVYALPLSYSFFSREESFELRSDSAIVHVIEPPLDTRPPDYSGVVGQVSVSARLDSGPARVGDPVALTVRVSGTGNVKLFRRPTLDVRWASIVEADERVVLDGKQLLIKGTKEFDWVLTPLRAGTVVLAPIRYPYFDPDSAVYRIAETRPETLHVAPGALAGADSSTTQQRMAVRTRFRGELASPLYTRSEFWLVLATAPFPAALVLLARRPRRSARPAPAARRLRSLTRFGARADVRAVRHAFLAAIGERIGTAVVDIAEPARLERALRLSGVTDATAADARTLSEAMTACAFGRATAELENIGATSHKLYRKIDREAKLRRAQIASVTPLLLIVGLSASVALAADVTPGAAEFERAVDAYQRGRFTEALADFAQVTQLAPRAPDAWANLGTAAWAAGDTARATLGWQRALRLEPLAIDVRERASLLGGSTRGAAYVPPVPVLPLALLAAGLWIASWTVVAWRGWRRSTSPSPMVAGLVGCALLLGAVAAGLDERLAARDLVVVARGVPVRALPVLASERGPSLFTGEITRVSERRGGWSRVTADGDRGGWVESSELLSLARD